MIGNIKVAVGNLNYPSSCLRSLLVINPKFKEKSKILFTISIDD
jgi:hypothetical protein